MRTTWTEWKPVDMRKAARDEARTEFGVLAAPERKFLETLPYYGAFSEFSDHVTDCADCRDDDRKDCPEGAALLEVARSGLAEQRRMSMKN